MWEKRALSGTVSQNTNPLFLNGFFGATLENPYGITLLAMLVIAVIIGMIFVSELSSIFIEQLPDLSNMTNNNGHRLLAMAILPTQLLCLFPLVYVRQVLEVVRRSQPKPDAQGCSVLRVCGRWSRDASPRGFWSA